MKRFWKAVSVEASEGGWQVTLDGRAVRTQGGVSQLLPTKTLADQVAQEFAEQGETIDPRKFVFRDMADYAFDVIAGQRAEAVTKLLEYLETDTLCYRADPGEALFARQELLWEPLVCACEARHAITLERVSGIIHRPQPETALDALRVRLEREDDFALAALATLTPLAASLVVALAVLEQGADPIELFAAANAEEDWQAEQWGWEEEAADVRIRKLAVFEQAAEFLAASRA